MKYKNDQNNNIKKINSFSNLDLCSFSLYLPFFNPEIIPLD